VIEFLAGFFFGVIIGGCVGAFVIALGVASKENERTARRESF